MVSSLLGTGAEEQEGNTLCELRGFPYWLIICFSVFYVFVENLEVLDL